MYRPILAAPVRQAIEIAVYLFLIFGIVVWCLRILEPFVSILMWGTIIAVSAYTPFLALRKRLGGRNKLAVTVFLVLGLAIIVVPAWLFTDSMIGSLKHFHTNLEAGQVEIPAANERVASWPVVGEKLYANWSQAAGNFESWVNAHSEQIRGVMDRLVHKLTSLGVTVLKFVAATLVAGLLLANGEASGAFVQKFCQRVAGQKGEEMNVLVTATIRSITVGVLGIAFIQAFLAGLGLVFIGAPAAGVLALVVLVFAIAQLPPWLVLVPVIIFIFSTQGVDVGTIVFAVWSIVVSFLDMVLKPLMLGRGVNVPMPVVLLGAIGGLILSGIIGLFLGAVVLALGYTLFMVWMEAGRVEPDPADGG